MWIWLPLIISLFGNIITKEIAGKMMYKTSQAKFFSKKVFFAFL